MQIQLSYSVEYCLGCNVVWAREREKAVGGESRERRQWEERVEREREREERREKFAIKL